MASEQPIPGYTKITHWSKLRTDMGRVQVEEKIDGSQFSMMVDADGALHCRSKGAALDLDSPQRLFSGAVATARRCAEAGLLVPGVVYRGESVQSPRHNVLAYDRAPAGNLVLWEMWTPRSDSYWSSDLRHDSALDLTVEPVPVLWSGDASDLTPEVLDGLLQTKSILGGSLVEGVVIKDYARRDRNGKLLAAKVVGEAFRETKGEIGRFKGTERADDGKVGAIARRFVTPARWRKALMRLREEGRVTDTDRDIGPIIKAVQADVLEECGDDIAAALLVMHRKEITNAVVHGLPEWYREQRYVDGVGEFAEGES